MSEPKRKLKTKLLFPFLRAVRALGAKELLAKIEAALKAGGGQLTQEAGLAIFGELVEHLPGAEDEVLEFIAMFLDKSRADVEEMDLFEETLPAAQAIFKDVRFPDFLRSAFGRAADDSTAS